jgi:hypothetical protein
MLCARAPAYVHFTTHQLHASTAPRGPYSSGVSFAGNTFTAVFVFQTVAVADEVLAGGGFQATAWLRENAAGDPIGLTISERDEASELCTLSPLSLSSITTSTVFTNSLVLAVLMLLSVPTMLLLRTL